MGNGRSAGFSENFSLNGIAIGVSEVSLACESFKLLYFGGVKLILCDRQQRNMPSPVDWYASCNWM